MNGIGAHDADEETQIDVGSIEDLYPMHESSRPLVIVEEDMDEDGNDVGTTDPLRLELEAAQPKYFTRHFIKSIDEQDQSQIGSSGTHGNVNANRQSRRTIQSPEMNGVKKTENNKVAEAKVKYAKLGKKKAKINGVDCNGSLTQRKRGRPRKNSKINANTPEKEETNINPEMQPTQPRAINNGEESQQQAQQSHSIYISKKELEDIRFAQTNPLIMLCEVARIEQQQVEQTRMQMRQRIEEATKQCPNQQAATSSSASQSRSPSSHSGFELAVGELRERYRLHDSLEAATSSATSCCSSKSHPSNGILSAEYFTQMKYEKPLTAAANLMNNNCLANDADKQSPTAIDENGYNCRLLLMTTKEAQNHLEFACLQALTDNIPLVQMSVKKGPPETVNDYDPFEFRLPNQCLKLLDPSSVDKLSRVILNWIDGWIRADGNSIAKQMREFSEITQMRWVLVFAIPQLCIFFLKKKHKISTKEAEKIFLNFE